MQFRGNQLFSERLAGVDMVRRLDVKGELYRRGVSGRDNDIIGRNKVNKNARFGRAGLLR